MALRTAAGPIIGGLAAVGLALAGSVAAAALATAGLYTAATRRLPPVERAVEQAAAGAQLDLQHVSPWVVKATVSTEDASFYSNPGLNFKGLARAVIANIAGDHFFEAEGGSSITQQLVKNVFIPTDQRFERSLSRKMREALYAIELDRRYTKEQILSWYLSVIYYGNNAIGIESAAQTYFGKPAAELNVAEASFLAGIPQWPVRYDPYTNFDACKRRQAQVLELMARHGYVTWPGAQRVLEQPLDLAERVVPL